MTVMRIGHAQCVEYMKSFGLPMMVLGGGGYTVRNVARCWTYETSVLLNAPVENDIPYNDFFEYYAPDFKLHLTPSNAENQNKPENLHSIVSRVLANLKNLQAAPSVQMHPIPPDLLLHMQQTSQSEREEANPDVRPEAFTKDGLGTRKEHEAEFYVSGRDVEEMPVKQEPEDAREEPAVVKEESPAMDVESTEQ